LPAQFTLSAEIKEQKSAVLEGSALIAVVRNADENEEANTAMAAINSFLSTVEKGRKEVKEPLIAAGRLIDETIGAFIEDVKSEKMRLGRVLGDFLALEDAKLRDAELARKKELDEIERQKREEMAKASTHEQREAIQATFERQAAFVAPPPPPIRAPGQQAREDWEIEDIDLPTLYRFYPHAVKMEARLTEVKFLLGKLKEGESLPGVKARKVIKAVTSAKRAKPIEIGGAA
jgi:hypothetical protein